MIQLEAPTLCLKDGTKQQVSAACRDNKAPQRAILGGNPITEHTTASHLLCCLNPWPMAIHLCLQPLTFAITIHADTSVGFSHSLKHPAWINHHGPNPSKPLSKLQEREFCPKQDEKNSEYLQSTQEQPHMEKQKYIRVCFPLEYST